MKRTLDIKSSGILGLNALIAELKFELFGTQFNFSSYIVVTNADMKALAMESENVSILLSNFVLSRVSFLSQIKIHIHKAPRLLNLCPATSFTGPSLSCPRPSWMGRMPSPSAGFQFPHRQTSARSGFYMILWHSVDLKSVQ